MNCNTNNGTERLNLDLKYEELDGYKNCTLSELLTLIIEEFIPKLYRNYVTMNVRFTSKHKKYLENIPSLLKNRKRALVTDILDKISRVTDEMRSSDEESVNNTFMVKSASDNTKYHTVYFGDNVNVCSCTCKEFRKTRMLCKHIIAMVLVGKTTFTDLSVLYLEHPLTNLDEDLFQNFQKNGSPKQVDSVNSGTVLTFFLFLGHVTGVHKEKSVEGDRLVRVDVSLTTVNNMLLKKFQCFLLCFQFCSIKL